jgi:hypothetical protein
MKRQRKKPILCVLCERENTRNASGVCSECKWTYENGKRLIDKFSDDKGELVSVRINNRLTSPSHAYGRGAAQRRAAYKWPTRPSETLIAAVLRCAGAALTWTTYAPNLNSGEKEVPPITVENLLYETGTGDAKAIMAPITKIEDLRVFFQALVDLMAEQYEKGYDAADSLLTRLANGELTVNELNDKKARQP